MSYLVNVNKMLQHNGNYLVYTPPPVPLDYVIIGTQTWKAKNVDDDIDFVSYEYGDVNTYGRLYSQSAFAAIEALYPGWHVPTDDEWATLVTYVGNNSGKLKEAGLEHWLTPNTDADDFYGFKALPTGRKSSIFEPQYITKYSYFWTSTLNEDFFTAGNWVYRMAYDTNIIFRNTVQLSDYMSIRLIKD